MSSHEMAGYFAHKTITVTTDKGNPSDRTVAWVCRRSLAETANSNPVGGMDVCPL